MLDSFLTIPQVVLICVQRFGMSLGPEENGMLYLPFGLLCSIGGDRMSTALSIGLALGAVILAAYAFVGGFALTRVSNTRTEAKRAERIIAESDAVFASCAATGETSFTVLVENNKLSVLDTIEVSHGISILVERNGSAFLMDLGKDELYSKNAGALGKDLSQVGFAFISHGHADHGGALEHFLNSNPTAPIYASERAMLDKHFVRIGRVIRKEISLDASLADRFPGRFKFAAFTTEIFPNVFVVPAINRQHRMPAGNKRLLKEASGHIAPDDFDHEQLLVLRDTDGLIIFSGCCHRGVLNAMDTVRAEFPDAPIKAVIGGFHLFDSARAKLAEHPDNVRDLGQAMLASERTLYVTGHCTGTEAYDILKAILGDRLAYASAGRQFRL